MCENPAAPTVTNSERQHQRIKPQARSPRLEPLVDQYPDGRPDRSPHAGERHVHTHVVLRAADRGEVIVPEIPAEVGAGVRRAQQHRADPQHRQRCEPGAQGQRRDREHQRPALARAVFDDVPLGRTCVPRTARIAATVPSGTTDSNAICSLGGQMQMFAEDHHELRGQHQVAAAVDSHPEHVLAEMRILAQDLEQHPETEGFRAPDCRVLFGEQHELAAHARATIHPCGKQARSGAGSKQPARVHPLPRPASRRRAPLPPPRRASSR